MNDPMIKGEIEQFFAEMTPLESKDAVFEKIDREYNKYLPSMRNGEYKKKLLKNIYTRYLRDEFDEVDSILIFTKAEVRFLNSLPSEKLKRMYYSFMIKAKLRPHKSGWISFDLPEDMYYGFGPRKAKAIRYETLNECIEFGLDFQIRGKENPLLCFKLPDLPEENGDPAISIMEIDSFKSYEEVLKSVE